jgi:hypothetical protein
VKGPLERLALEGVSEPVELATALVGSPAERDAVGASGTEAGSAGETTGWATELRPTTSAAPEHAALDKKSGQPPHRYEILVR